MHRNTKTLLAFLAAFVLSLGLSFGQPPTDSLNGKTIHIYVESDNFNAFYFQNGDIPFRLVSKYNYTLTLTGRDLYQQDFFFTSNGNSPAGEHFKWKFGKTGLNESVEGRITVPEFQGKDTMWVIVDPAGPVTAPPLIMLQAPKFINILNPWSTTAPKLVYGTKTRAMTTTPGRCGWFTTLILDPAITAGYFAEINNTGTYGKAGLDSPVNFDFAAEFASKGNTIWLNTVANAWTPAWPNLDGDCQYLMAATVRDVSKDHLDFDFGNITGDFLTKGMVQPTIGADRKPVSTKIALKTPITYGSFDTWWNTDSTNADPKQRSYESCIDIPMSKSSDGLWEYDSYKDSPTDRSFFPVEGAANRFNETTASCYVKPPPDTTVWTTGGPLRNGNFCMESHATFIYQPGQRFAFRGDDDVWVFINDKLVVDLGGVHTPKSDSVNLDLLGLQAGKEYKWDFFYCDRQPCGSSLRVKTSIFFKQQRALYGIELPGPTPGSVSLEIWKREGGKGSCASIGNTSDSTKASNLVYQVINASGTLVKDLGNGGKFYGGAIDIATPKITVDTAFTSAAWDTLTPGGTYRVVAFEPANQTLKVEVPFKIPVRSFVEFVAPLTNTAPVGTLVRVIAGNQENGLHKNQAGKYTPIIPGGLEVYQDSAKTAKVMAGTELTTAASGYDTLWVTGVTSATADQTYLLTNPAPAKVSLALTFLVPKDRVEFEGPPFTRSSLMGTLVTLNLANKEAGMVVPGVKTFSLTFTPVGLKLFADPAMTQPIGSTPVSTGADGKFILYATADSTDPVTKTYTLKITGTPQDMALTFTMPDLDLPKVLSAGIHDDNGDGKGDRVAVVYDRDISASPPKAVAHRWPASATRVPGPAGADLAKAVVGANLVYTGEFATAVETFGEGLFLSTYNARGVDSVQSIKLTDRIGPIIKAAEIVLGPTQDTLHIRFSEAIGDGITVSPAELFGYRRMKDGAEETIEPLSVTWSPDRMEAILVFTNTTANAPRSGNQVRISEGPGRIADALGNAAGPNSLFRVIVGGKRSQILTETLMDKPITSGLFQENSLVTTLQPPNAVIGEVVQRTGRLGHLIKTDLAGYAVKDDFTNVEPRDVVLEYQVNYFTNLGVPVTGEKRAVACTDALFGGNCLGNPGYLFVGWNFTAKERSLVATGAYISRIRYQVKVGGKTVEQGGLDQTWGYVRR